jgi:diaminopimelate dehydrogenase
MIARNNLGQRSNAHQQPAAIRVDTRAIRMKRRRLAIIGLGKVGLACGKAIAATEDLAIAGIVRRPVSLNQPLPPPLQAATVVADASEIDAIDVALICLPPPLVLEAATDLLQHRIPIVEAAILTSRDRASYREVLDRVASRHRTAAVIGAGWDPGMLSVFCGLFAVMSPKGHTDARDRPGISLHHTLAARALPGIKDALCTELSAEGGRKQRYVYAELEPEADTQAVIRAVQSDPLFLDEESVVIPVGRLAESRGGGPRRRAGTLGVAAGDAHQRFLLEGRFDLVSVTAQIMVAATRATSLLGPGAHRLSDIPPRALWQGISEHNDDTPERG